MMGLEEIIQANKNPQKWREETGRTFEYRDHGNYWPGKYASAASAYKPVHGGYPSEKGLSHLSAAADEGRMTISVEKGEAPDSDWANDNPNTPSNPIPGSNWDAEMQTMQEALSETLHRERWTLADELRRKPEAIEFDATKLAGEMLDKMAKLALAYAKLSTSLHIHRNVARLGVMDQHNEAHADLQNAMIEAGNLLFV
jgi:hypothetical protein